MEDKDPATSLRGARHLWTGRFQAVLSTHSRAEPGYPFGSVVPYCLDAEGLPILLLSHLAQHSRNLADNRRCAFTLAEPTAGDLYRSDRLTCVGECSPLPAEDTRAVYRYLRYYPSGRTYFEGLNFRFYRLVPLRFHYNGGFATARWAGTERILRPSLFDSREEQNLIDEIEQRHPHLSQERFPAPAEGGEAVCVTGIDPHGLDLRRGEHLTRIHFPHTLDRSESIHAYLRTLYR